MENTTPATTVRVGNGTAVHAYHDGRYTAADGKTYGYENTECGAVELGGNALYGHRTRALHYLTGVAVTCKRCLKALETGTARAAEAAEAEELAAQIAAEAPAHVVPASHADRAATMAAEIAAVLAGDAQPPTAQDMDDAKGDAAAARLRRDELAEYAHGAGPDSPEVQEVMAARDAERHAAAELDRIVILRDAWHARLDRLTVSEKDAELQAARDAAATARAVAERITARRAAGKPARDRFYAMDHAAIKGETVTQGHADYCAEHGHAVTIVEGQDQGVCPRCGDVTMSATEHAALVAECMKAAEATARCTGSVGATHSIERVLPTTGTRYTVATATWNRAEAEAADAAEAEAVADEIQAIRDAEAPAPADTTGGPTMGFDQIMDYALAALAAADIHAGSPRGSSAYRAAAVAVRDAQAAAARAKLYPRP